MVIEQETNSRDPVAEFDANALEVGGVVVYPDRAEVKRLIRASLKKGENDVMINQLPSVVDPKSLRSVRGFISTRCVVYFLKVDMEETNS